MPLTSTDNTPESELPWHKQFWAWFVLTPLIVVVISCSITVSIAVMNADDRVVDEYYKEGRLINNRLDEDIAAANLSLVADIQFDRELGELVVRLDKNSEQFANELLLELSHVSNKDYDHHIRLTHIARGQYHAELENDLNYRWYLRLKPQDTFEQPWRLRGEIDFSRQQSVRLASAL